MLRRAIDAEKPAQTQYDLCLLQPTFRIGVQSTIAVDTIIGATPQTSLACMYGADEPQSPSPRGRLGLDTVLSSATGDAVMWLGGPGTTVGKGSLLA